MTNSSGLLTNSMVEHLINVITNFLEVPALFINLEVKKVLIEKILIYILIISLI